MARGPDPTIALVADLGDVDTAVGHALDLNDDTEVRCHCDIGDLLSGYRMYLVCIACPTERIKHLFATMYIFLYSSI